MVAGTPLKVTAITPVNRFPQICAVVPTKPPRGVTRRIFEVLELPGAWLLCAFDGVGAAGAVAAPVPVPPVGVAPAAPAPPAVVEAAVVVGEAPRAWGDGDVGATVGVGVAPMAAPGGGAWIADAAIVQLALALPVIFNSTGTTAAANWKISHPVWD